MSEDWCEKISNEEYHHGPEWGPMLGSSALKILINETPEKFDWYRNHPHKTTPAMEFGSAVHVAALEPHKLNDEVARWCGENRTTKYGKALWKAFIGKEGWEDEIVRQVEFSGSKSSVREQKKHFKEESQGKIVLSNSEFYDMNLVVRDVFSIIGPAEGKIVLSVNDYETMQDMADAVHNHALTADFLSNMPHREISVSWYDEAFGCDCKCRPDALGFNINKPDQHIILDLKTYKGIAPTFKWEANKRGYLISAAWYRRGIKAAKGDHCEFMFLVVEKEPPYSVSLHQADPFSLDVIDEEIEKAGEVFRECTENNRWPGWPNEIKSVGLTSF